MNTFQRIYTVLFSLCLLAFCTYALLDTFVIRRVYAVQGEAPEAAYAGTPMAAQADTPAQAEEFAGADGEAEIRITQYRVEDTTVYVADVQLDEGEQLKTAFSLGSYGRNLTADTSETAAAVGATLAINGDNYGSRERGYVIRNGVLYRDTAARDQEDLVIYADGSLAIINESEVTARQLLEQGAVQVFSFGPGLIEEGAICVDADDEVDRAKASNPRTALGLIDEGHYVFVVSDGRSTESEGLTLLELAQFMQGLGVETAYNLDGGGSSTLVYEGEVLNNPTSGRRSGERAVTDIIYI